MELIECNNASFRLFVIFLVGLCLQVSNAREEIEKATCTDQDLTKPEVTILQGSIRGVTMSTLKNRSISGFLGVPYAQPPIGNLRFTAPVPVEAWNGTLNAESDTSDCPQIRNGLVIGNEDCLYINVYTPKLPLNQDSKLLPVMMYIHGGGFIQDGNNSTLYGPGYLLDKDVVLVVPSYRLGPLGFLSTGDAECPGNWGLKDQILALEWVHDNIEFFGGDPNQVTILGQSAGSMSVNYLALTHLTNGLFHRYITQSSSALSTMAYQSRDTAIKNAFKLGEYFGCITSTSAFLVECLRVVDFTQILNSTLLFTVWEIYPLVSFMPTMEPDLPGAVLTDTPGNLVAAGKLRDLPYLVGSVPMDGIVLAGYFYRYADKFDEFRTNFDSILPYVLNYNDKVNDVSAYTSALKSYYFNNDLTSSNTTAILSNLTQLCSDLIANFPNHAELQQPSTNNAKYLYSFEYRGTYSYSYIWTFGLMDDFGVAHCDELIYLFPQSEALFADFNETMSESDLKMVETMVELWTSFVITGKPKTTASTCGKSWPPYSKNMDLLRIGNGAEVSLKIKNSKYANQLQFFKSLTAIYI